MIITSNAGIIDSYSTGLKKKFSYGTFINGFKFEPSEYDDTVSGEVDFVLFLEKLYIDNKLIINNQTLLGGFDDEFQYIPYRDDGYGLGASAVVDILNNLGYLSKYGIFFYTFPGDKILIKTRDKTRFVAVFSDNWYAEGNHKGARSWTLMGNYPYSFDDAYNESVGFPNRELLISDSIGNLIPYFDFQQAYTLQNFNPWYSI